MRAEKRRSNLGPHFRNAVGSYTDRPASGPPKNPASFAVLQEAISDGPSFAAEILDWRRSSERKTAVQLCRSGRLLADEGGESDDASRCAPVRKGYCKKNSINLRLYQSAFGLCPLSAPQPPQAYFLRNLSSVTISAACRGGFGVSSAETLTASAAVFRGFTAGTSN